MSKIEIVKELNKDISKQGEFQYTEESRKTVRGEHDPSSEKRLVVEQRDEPIEEISRSMTL